MTLQPLLEAGIAIQIHTLAAFLAFFLGAMILFRRKGDRFHRNAGRVWVALMVIVSITSFFIHAIRMVGIWSPIHLLSIVTLWFLVRGVQAAWRHRITEHRATMQAIYLMALVGAGFFTFMPGRIMHAVFFEGPSPWTGVVASIALLALIGALILVFAKEAIGLRDSRQVR